MVAVGQEFLIVKQTGYLPSIGTSEAKMETWEDGVKFVKWYEV